MFRFRTFSRRIKAISECYYATTFIEIVEVVSNI